MSHAPSDLGRLGVLYATSALTVMSGAAVSPALTAIRDAFPEVQNGAFQVKLLLVLPAAAIALTAPLLGQIIDRLGRKRLLLVMLALYGAAGTTGLYLSSLSALLAGRVVLGFAVGGTMTAATTLIGDYYEGERRSQVMGTQAAFMALGGVGIILGAGLLADRSWRFPFGIYGVSWLLLPAAMWFIREPHLSVQERSVQAKAQITGQVPWALLTLNYVMLIVGMLLFYLIPAQLPFYLEELGSGRASLIGTAIASGTLAGAAGGFTYHRIQGILSRFQIYTAVLFLCSIGFAIIAGADGYTQVLIGLLAGGFGFGMNMPNGNLWVSDLAPVHLRGTFVGMATACVFIGQFMSPFAASPFVDHFGLGGATGIFGLAAMFAMGVGFLFLLADAQWGNAINP